MKATIRSSRSGSAVHNEHRHIPEEDRDAMIFDFTHIDAKTLREKELAVYSDKFKAGIEERNAHYLAQRHAERMRTLEQIYAGRHTRPEECILQVGNIDETIDRALFIKIVTDFCRWLQDWNREHGYPFILMNVVYHFDEATPHAHLRRVWKYTDKDGFVRIGLEKALEMAGVELPDPGKKAGRYNNRKMTFDAMAREKWYQILREHGLDIDTKPLPSRRHLSVREYTAQQIRAKEVRMEELTEASEALENEIIRKQTLAAEAENKAAEARRKAFAAKEAAVSASQQMIESQEEAARCRREARLAHEMLRDITAETEDARNLLKAYLLRIDREKKADLTGIMDGIAAMQELEVVRKEHPELFDAKGWYKKKARREERGDGYKDIFRH